MELTKGQKMLITNMINHELKHMDSTVYCYNELTELKQALNIDDVSNCCCVGRDTLTPEARKMFDDIDKALEKK